MLQYNYLYQQTSSYTGLMIHFAVLMKNVSCQSYCRYIDVHAAMTQVTHVSNHI